MRVKDVLTLKAAQQFRIVAGAAGLFRIVENEPSVSREALIHRFAELNEFKNWCVLCKFYDGLILIVSHETNEPQKFTYLANQIFMLCGPKTESPRLSYSDIHPSATMLNHCVQEAKNTYIASLVLDCRKMWYRQIGVLSYLIPLSDNVHTAEYMRRFLAPILDNPEYMQTAIAFVRAEGNYEAASQYLNYHKNTLRYRINKIQAWLAPDESWDFFYQNLASTIKIYLIKKYIL